MAASDKTQPDPGNLEWVRLTLLEAHARQHFGKFTVIMENGNVVRMVAEQSLTPPKPS